MTIHSKVVWISYNIIACYWELNRAKTDRIG
nr:MAG TPA: hypothetical protein [Caudoviricetes sp.]